MLLFVWAFPSFNFWVVFHCIDDPQFVYPFTCWWTFGLPPIFSSYKKLGIFMWKSLYRHKLLFLLDKYLGVGWLGHMVGICLIFRKLPRWVYHFTFPPEVYKSPRCLCLPRHLIWSVFNFRLSNRCAVLSHCGFNLHFPITSDVEHLLLCLFDIHISSWM